MRIRINEPKENGSRRFRLNLPVPLGLLNLPLTWRFLPPEQKQYQPIAKALVKALKEYRKENGSWNLVEVHTHDNQDIIIRI
ncbi:MAG: hypothetical protein IJ863_01985 [Spirochaetales bacterium]|nr:hypothetical protein [Spirochaetales bacterium]